MAPYNDESHFRGIHIAILATQTHSRLPWTHADRTLFHRHASRFQMTCLQNIQLGTDELALGLGISQRTQFYQSAVLKRAQSALLYLVTVKLRAPPVVLTVKREVDAATGASRMVARWPKWTVTWLKREWDGDVDVPVGWRGREAEMRDDPVGVRAATPPPRRNRSLESLISASTARPVQSNHSVVSVASNATTPRGRSPTRRPPQSAPERRARSHSQGDMATLLARVDRNDERFEGIANMLDMLLRRQQAVEAERTRERVRGMSVPSESPVSSHRNVYTPSLTQAPAQTQDDVFYPPQPPQTNRPLSHDLALQSITYSIAELNHHFEAGAAGLSGDFEAQRWHMLGAQQARVHRERVARQALEALRVERRGTLGGVGLVPWSAVWDVLLKMPTMRE